MSNGREVEHHENLEAQLPWWQLAICSVIGAVICVTIDMATKREASEILKIANGIKIVLEIRKANLIAIIAVIAFAVGLSFVFQPKSKKSAFILGLGILSFIMVSVPGSFEPLKTTGHSTNVYIQIESGQKETFDRIIVKVWDLDRNRQVGQMVYYNSRFSFVLEAPSRYIVTVEASGYRVLDREIDLRSDPPEIHLNLQLQRTNVPLLLQRVLR